MEGVRQVADATIAHRRIEDAVRRFMRKSPWRRPKSSMDWPEMIVTGWIVVMSAVLVGSVLSRYLYR